MGDLTLCFDGPRASMEVLAWLAKHSRFHIHFTPTSTSWLNMVERFFRDITDKRIWARRVHQRGRVGGGHQRVHRRAQRQTKAVHLDRQGQRHPGQGHSGAGRPE